MKKKFKMDDDAQVSADVVNKEQNSTYLISTKENTISKAMSKVRDIDPPEVKEKAKEVEQEFVNSILDFFQPDVASPTDIKIENIQDEDEDDEISIDTSEDEEDGRIDDSLAAEFEDEEEESEEFNLNDEEESNDINLEGDADKVITATSKESNMPEEVRAAFSSVLGNDLGHMSESKPISRMERINAEDKEFEDLKKRAKASKIENPVYNTDILDKPSDDVTATLENLGRSVEDTINTISFNSRQLNTDKEIISSNISSLVQDVLVQGEEDRDSQYITPPTETLTKDKIIGFGEEYQKQSQELDAQEKQQLAELEEIEQQRREQDLKLESIYKRQREIAEQRELLKSQQEKQARLLEEQQEQERQLALAKSELENYKEKVDESSTDVPDVKQNTKMKYIANIKEAKSIKESIDDTLNKLEDRVKNSEDDLGLSEDSIDYEELFSKDTSVIQDIKARLKNVEDASQNEYIRNSDSSPLQPYKVEAKPFELTQYLADMMKDENVSISYISDKRKLKDALLKSLVEKGLYYTEVEKRDYPASVIPTGTELFQKDDKYYCAYTTVPSIYAGYRKPLIQFIEKLKDMLKNLVVTEKASISLINEEGMNILTFNEYHEIDIFLKQNNVAHRVEGTSLILSC